MLETESQPESSTPREAQTDKKRPAQEGNRLGVGALIAGLGLVAALWVAQTHGWGQLDLPVSHVRGSDWDFQLTLVEACARIWSAGELPVWNPWTAGGVPLWANPEAPVFHPISWAAIVAHPATVARVVLIAHLALQVMGTAALARMLGARWFFLPVVLVGLLTTDVLVWRMAHGHLMMAQAAWIPWAMALMVGLRSPLRAGAAAAAVTALAVHGGGHYPAWIAAASTALLLACTHLASMDRFRARALFDPVVRLVSFASLLLLLAAPRWLPTARALADTPRLRGPQAPLAMGDFSIVDGLSFVFASALGAGDAPGLHEGLPAWGTPLFALLSALALASALATRRSPVQRTRMLGALAAATLFAAVSIGHNLPGNAYAWLHSVPPLDRFRNPERWAMAWLPLLTAVSAAGLSRLWDQVGHRTQWMRPVGTIAVLGLLVVHWTLATPGTTAHSRIDQVTTDTYDRLPRSLPVFVRDPPRTNFEGTGHNEGCGDCSDALLHEAPPELPDGPFRLAHPAELRDWRPDRVRFFVPIDPSANPKMPMVTEVVVPQAHRLGWTATDSTGLALRVVADPAGTRVRVPTPGREVVLQYALPGWSLARALGVLGVCLWAAAMLGGRRLSSIFATRP